MRVIVLSLILIGNVSLNACRTCYYYDQQTTHDESHCPCTRPSHCDPSAECCTNGPTQELEDDYYTENK